MESTFKKEYEVQNLADGSMELSFTENRVGVHQSTALVKLLTIALLFASFFGALALTYLITRVTGEDNFGTKFLMSGLVMLAILFLLLKKLFIRKGNILVTNQGLIFDNSLSGKMQLAFKDVTEWGIRFESSQGNSHVKTAYLYAQAGGKEFKMTKYLSPALANGLNEEIKRHVEKIFTDKYDQSQSGLLS